MSSSMSGSKPRFNDKVPSGYKAGAIQQFTPEQMQLHEQLFSHVGPESYLSRLAGGDQSMFGEIEAPALRQFNELQGGLASRFSGMGGMGARHSSGFQNTANAASSNFAQELQAQRQGLQRQAIQDLMGYSGEILNQRPYQRTLTQKPQKESSGFGGILGGGLGAIGGFLAGGPAGAFQGAQLGYGVGSGF